MKTKEDWEEGKEGRGRGDWEEKGKDGSNNRLSYGEEENCRRERG